MSPLSAISHPWEGNELHKYSKFELACHFTVVLSCIWRKPRFSKITLINKKFVRLTNSRDRINFYQIMLSCAHFSPPHTIISLWLLFEFAAEARESFSHKLLVPTHSARTPSSIYQRSRVSKITKKIILRSYRANSRFSCRMNQKRRRRRLFKLIRVRCEVDNFSTVLTLTSKFIPKIVTKPEIGRVICYLYGTVELLQSDYGFAWVIKGSSRSFHFNHRIEIV